MSLNTVILLELRYKNNTDGSTIPFRLTSAPFDVTYSGYTWSAAGDLLKIGKLEANYELITEGLEITLSGVNTAYQALIDQHGFRNAPVDIWLASLDDDANTVAAAKYYHRGFAGTPVTEYDEETGTISVVFETQSAFKSLDRNSQLMTTSLAHHRSLHTNDNFFLYVADTGIGEETWKD